MPYIEVIPLNLIIKLVNVWVLRRVYLTLGARNEAFLKSIGALLAAPLSARFIVVPASCKQHAGCFQDLYPSVPVYGLDDYPSKVAVYLAIYSMMVASLAPEKICMDVAFMENPLPSSAKGELGQEVLWTVPEIPHLLGLSQIAINAVQYCPDRRPEHPQALAVTFLDGGNYDSHTAFLRSWFPKLYLPQFLKARFPDTFNLMADVLQISFVFY